MATSAVVCEQLIPPFEEEEYTDIFVYGSLRRGQWNHWYIENCDFLGEDCITGKVIPNLRIPAITPGEDTIWGEVYRCDSKTMVMVDKLEGINCGMYVKTLVKTFLNRDVYVYYAGENLQDILRILLEM